MSRETYLGISFIVKFSLIENVPVPSTGDKRLIVGHSAATPKSKIFLFSGAGSHQ